MIFRNRVNASAKMNACPAQGMREKCPLELLKESEELLKTEVAKNLIEFQRPVTSVFDPCNTGVFFLSIVFSYLFKGDLGGCVKGWSWLLISFYLPMQLPSLTPPPLPLPTRKIPFTSRGIPENSIVFLRESTLSGFFFWGEENRGTQNRTWFLSSSKAVLPVSLRSKPVQNLCNLIQ